MPVKAQLRREVIIDAPGFENRKVRVRLLLDDQEVNAQDATLTLTNGNEVTIKGNAPAKAGEVKVTVKVDPLQGEVNPNNNSIDTYVTVVQEGISVLLVDKQRAWEPQMICDALAEESRIRLYPVWLRRDDSPTDKGDGLFQFDKQQYDVVILGDVTARQMRAANPKSLAEIKKLVEKGAGFLMLGGYASFGNGDWQGTEIADLLPVNLDTKGQSDSETKMLPTSDGLAECKYFLQLTEKKGDVACAFGEPARTGRCHAARLAQGRREQGGGRDDRRQAVNGGWPLRRRPHVGVWRRHHASLDTRFGNQADAPPILAAAGNLAGGKTRWRAASASFPTHDGCRCATISASASRCAARATYRLKMANIPWKSLGRTTCVRR